MVSAGTMPTSVRVRATVRGSELTTLSSKLVVSSGVPEEGHFLLDWKYCRDDLPNCITFIATLGDHFNNAVPDDTAVNFTSSSGVIQASCFTERGDVRREFAAGQFAC